MSGALGPQPDPQTEAGGRFVLDGHFQITVLQIILGGGGIVLLPQIVGGAPHHADGFQPLDAILGQVAAQIALAVVDDPLAQCKIIFIAVAHRHQQVAVLGAVFLRGGKAFFPGGLQPVVPADAQFFQLCGLLSCQAARALPGLYLPLELEPLAHGHAAVDGIAPGQLQGTLFGGGIGGSLTQHLPAGLHLPAQLAVQAVGLLHGALLPEARRFAAGLGHGLGAVTLQGAAVAQPLELRHQVKHRHAAAACSHQSAAEHLLEGGHQAGLAHQNDPGQPLQRLLDSRRVDTEQDLGAGGCIGEEGLHGGRIRKAGVIRGVKADGRVHSAQQLFQLRAQLFLIGGGFKQDQIMAAGIAEQAGQQNGQVFHLTQRPAQLFILHAQGGVALGHTQVFDPGAQGGQLLLLRPEQGCIGRGHRHGPGGHGLGHSHVGDDAVGKQLLRGGADGGTVGHTQPQHLCLGAHPQQLLHRLCPAHGAQLMVAVQHDAAGFLLPQPHPLLRGGSGQLFAITEADIAGQGTAVVACQLCLPQGQTLCTGHQPEKGGLGVSLHHLPGNTAFAGAGGVEHGGPVQGLQRLYSFLKSGFVDGIQGHRHGGSVLSELHV